MGRTQTIGRHATTVSTVDGETRVTYHHTAVVRFSPTRVVLDSNGHRTATTKLRMNQAANQYGLRFHVYQKNHEWFVWVNGCPEEVHDFRDGMTLLRDVSTGVVTGVEYPDSLSLLSYAETGAGLTLDRDP